MLRVAALFALAACRPPAPAPRVWLPQPALSSVGEHPGYAVIADCSRYADLGVLGRGDATLGRALAERLRMEARAAFPSIDGVGWGIGCDPDGVEAKRASARVYVEGWSEVDAVAAWVGAWLAAEGLGDEVSLVVRPVVAPPDPAICYARSPLERVREAAGSIPLPPVGEAALGRLDDGRPVWLVHHAPSCVSALEAIGPWAGWSGMGRVVDWSPSLRVFSSGPHPPGLDEYGVGEGYALTALAVEPAGAAARVGRRVEVSRAALPPPDRFLISPWRRAQPALAWPRAAPEAIASAPDGWLLIEGDLVRKGRGPFQVCALPEEGGRRTLDGFTGCPEAAPRVRGLKPPHRPSKEGVAAWTGPLFVRVEGGEIREVAQLQKGHMGRWLGPAER